MAEKNPGFSQRLKMLLKEKGISQVNLADRCGVTKNVVTKYTKHGGVPEWHILVKIARSLNTTTDFLLMGKKAKVPQIPEWLKELLPILESLPQAGRDRLRSWVEGYVACLGDVEGSPKGGVNGPAPKKRTAGGGA
jgi:transcriptional regulator with XRE-family HTH domain